MTTAVARADNASISRNYRSVRFTGVAEDSMLSTPLSVSVLDHKRSVIQEQLQAIQGEAREFGFEMPSAAGVKLCVDILVGIALTPSRMSVDEDGAIVVEFINGDESVAIDISRDLVSRLLFFEAGKLVRQVLLSA